MCGTSGLGRGWPGNLHPMKRSLAIAAISLPIIAGALTAVPAAHAGDVMPIVIAVEAPLSGAQANNGRDIARGVALAVRQANAAGGIEGRPIQLVRIDDQANPDLALDAVAKAKAAGAVAVIGPYNSSVGLVNLQAYIDAGITPVQMTSTDATTGLGVTVQPKNSQISPTEIEYVLGLAPKNVVMLVDPSAYTASMADRMRKALKKDGIHYSSISIEEGKASYAPEVNEALRRAPDFIYVSTYYPQGALIADSLSAPRAKRSEGPRCLMGLANVDAAFITAAGLGASQHCVFSGIPEAPQLPIGRASLYVSAYEAAFGVVPGVWGAFSYDSANILFAAVASSGSTEMSAVMAKLLHVTRSHGATGSITINPDTGNREHLPIYIMQVDAAGQFLPIGVACRSKACVA